MFKFCILYHQILGNSKLNKNSDYTCLIFLVLVVRTQAGVRRSFDNYVRVTFAHYPVWCILS